MIPIFHGQNRLSSLPIPIIPSIWYRGDNIFLSGGTQVAIIYDLSGNNRDAIRVGTTHDVLQTTNANGYKGINVPYSNYGDYFTIDNVVTYNFETTIFVVSVPDPQNDNYHSLSSGYLDGNLRSRLFYDTNGNNRFGVGTYASSGGATIDERSILYPYTPKIEAFTKDNIWKNYTKVTTGYESSDVTNFGSMTHLMTGTIGTITDKYIGTLYEFIVYDYTMSDTEIEDVLDYINDQYPNAL